MCRGLTVYTVSIFLWIAAFMGGIMTNPTLSDQQNNEAERYHELVNHFSHEPVNMQVTDDCMILSDVQFATFQGLSCYWVFDEMLECVEFEPHLSEVACKYLYKYGGNAMYEWNSIQHVLHQMGIQYDGVIVWEDLSYCIVNYSNGTDGDERLYCGEFTNNEFEG